MAILVFSAVGAAERGLHCENVSDVEFTEHCDSCGTLLESVHGETTLFEGEKVTEFGHDVGENTRFMGLFFDMIAVHENIFTTRVAMQVAIEINGTLISELSYQFFHRKVYWMDDSTRRFPPTIEILSRQRASIISIYNSVRI